MSDEAVIAPVQGMMFCATCGAQIAANAPTCVKCGAPNATVVGQTSDKTMIAAALLCFFLGGFGIHRFYVGKVLTGILFLVLLVAAGIVSIIPVIGLFVAPVLVFVIGLWALIDFIMILIGSFRDGRGLPLKR